ncbi:type II toxin-antitoxin system HicA family toxin [Nocardiopsis valliformis]|uniref:type II toxin-antitoxin system HicA family toxin n=1 Tax=Nocardiopsis valliformis TaxID=239974 RepID=UPI000475560B|nr:type II toxin-antitoxin system HicA family toxin [Nocardiopsis valliformis]
MAPLSHYPAVTGDRLIRALGKVGFVARPKRGKGGHVVLLHPDGRQAVVPVHGGRDLKRTTVRAIVEGLGMGPEELKKLL